MNLQRRTEPSTSRWCSRISCLVAICTLAVPLVAAAEAEKRREIAKCLSPSASVLTRTAMGQPWHVAKQGEAVYSGDMLLAVPLTDLDVNGGKVRLHLLADLEGRSPFPIIETAVILHDNPKVDLDLTLDRGRVTITSRGTDGKPVHAIVRFRDQVWNLDLVEKGASVGLEIYGRWPRGVPFKEHPTPQDVPALDAVVLAISGHVSLKFGDYQYLLKAAPGRAQFHWNSGHGPDTAPEYLAEAPAWAHAPVPGATPEMRRRKESIERFRKVMLEQSVGAALDEFIASDDPNRRRLAVYAMGALDDGQRLGQALSLSKHADTWDNAVVASRHWLGRGPGQDQLMYRFLVDVAKAPPAEAAITLQLLHSFGEDECCQPELYELLIEYLRSDRFGVRGLAHWHLKRLVPEGKKIAYDPHGSKEELERGYKEWKKLIPTGQLPPAHHTKTK